MDKSVIGYKALAVAMAGVAMNAHSAGLDRSGQDVSAFLQDGTYAEAVYTYMDTNVAGHDNGVANGASSQSAYVQGNATGNVTETYDFFRYGVKGDISDRISVGVLYDEPFGASVQHENNGISKFVSQGTDTAVQGLTAGTPLASVPPAQLMQLGTVLQSGNPTVMGAAQAQIKTQLEALTRQQLLANPTTANLSAAQLDAIVAQQVTNELVASTARSIAGVTNIAKTAEAQKGQGTNVEIRTQNVTGLLGFKFGANRNFQVFGGAAAQRLTGEVHLRGLAYQQATGYDARISPDQAIGWVAGVAYYKPEIALKGALTYRSEIEHKTDIAEIFPALGLAGVKTQDFKVALPESFNLDFQTGISPTMLLTAKARYVPWSKFAIDPTLYTATTNTSIVSYDKDQWSGEIGLGKKVSDNLSVSGNIGYDSGAGNPVSSLGPVKGFYSVGGGIKYSFNPAWSVSVGGKYLKFGDADAQLPNKQMVGKFADNDGFVAGLKVAYQAK